MEITLVDCTKWSQQYHSSSILGMHLQLILKVVIFALCGLCSLTTMAQSKRSDDNSAVLNKGLDKMGSGVKIKSRSSSSYDFVFDSICYRVTDRTLLTCEVAGCMRGYRPSTGIVVIPALVSDKGQTWMVTSIGDRAFYQCTSIKNVALPASVKSIGDETFFGCSALKYIYLPSALIEIGTSAFAHCSSLESFHVPSSVKRIGNGAFTACSSLKRVGVHGALPPKMGNQVFASCHQLDSVFVPVGAKTHYHSTPWNACELVEVPKLAKYDNFEQNGIYYKNDGLGRCEVVSKRGYSGSVVIPASVEYYGEQYSTEIDFRSFEGSYSLEHLVILSSGFYSFSTPFRNCRSLKTIQLPSTLVFIDLSWFATCQSLKSIEIPASVEKINNGCATLTQITLLAYTPPENADFLSKCKNLSTIYVPAGAHDAYNKAPWNQYSIVELKGPKRGAVLDIDGFQYRVTSSTTCELAGIPKKMPGAVAIPSSVKYGENHFAVTGIGVKAFFERRSLREVNLPSSISYISDNAFTWSDSLQSIRIPASVIRLGKYVFVGCRQLNHIEVDANNPVFDSRDHCNAIISTADNKLLSACNNSRIPSSVTSIGDGAFYFCESLESIQIPSSVTSIGNEAFSNCESLESIQIPSSVTSIGNGAFSSCYALESIQIPSSVTSIGDKAFSWCKSLKSIQIPSSVTSIGDEAFSWCGALTTMKWQSSTPPVLGFDILRFCDMKLKIYVPRGSKQAYEKVLSDHTSKIIEY